MSSRPASERTRCWRCGNLPAAGEPPLPCPRCDTRGSPRKRGPGFVGGLLAVFRGFGFLGKHPALWKWLVLPLVLNAAIFGVISWWSWGHAAQFVPDMTQPWEGFWSWMDWLRASLQWLLPNLMLVVVVLASLVTTLLVSGVVNAPFYDLLSEKTEVMALNKPELERSWAKFVPDIFSSTLAALIIVVRQVIVMGVLFLLSFTAIGAPLFIVAGFFFTGYALADVPMARKRYAASERITWGRSHWLHLVGVGLPINLVPVLAPFGIVGATLAYLEQPDKG